MWVMIIKQNVYTTDCKVTLFIIFCITEIHLQKALGRLGILISVVNFLSIWSTLLTSWEQMYTNVYQIFVADVVYVTRL